MQHMTFSDLDDPTNSGRVIPVRVQRCSLYKTLILFEHVDDAMPNTVRGSIINFLKDKRLVLIWKQLFYLRALDVWCDMLEPLSIT
jgi:hypothetical protein